MQPIIEPTIGPNLEPTVDPTASSRSQTEMQSLPAQKPPRKRFRLVALAAFLVLLLIVIPPFININHFRRSIIHSIGDGLGRPVHASSVELVLFPRPGFVLHNLTVDENPAFGAEPVMMAASVTATLRASTLWHRRVEIATLRFDTPSVNLTRNAEGHWNFESLLQNSPALHAQVARVAVPVHFPYIEATEARINFKMDAEKLPFSLENANLSLWKESGGTWHVRLRARPVRTDITVADAGEIRGEAALKSASVLNESTLQAHFEWREVELGEIGRLLSGHDDGWRGMVDWSAQAQGTLTNLPIRLTIAVDSFHRAEFIPLTEMDLTAQCGLHFGTDSRMLETLHCVTPVGARQIIVRGVRAQSANRPPAAEFPSGLQMEVRHAPAQFFLNLFRHIHPGIAEGIRASGNLAGVVTCDMQGLNGRDNCTGQIQSPAVTLHIPNTEHSLKVSPVLLTNLGVAVPPRATGRKSTQRTASPIVSSSGWILSPAHVALGASNPATLTGTLNSAGVALSLSGPADLSRLAAFARALHISAALGEVQSIRGSAQVALLLNSNWLPQPALGAEALGQPIAQFIPSRWEGSLQIRDATVKTAFLPDDLHLASGRLNFSPSGVSWTHLAGTFAHTAFDGAVLWQTPCAGWNADCGRSFQFHVPNLNLSRIEAALHHDTGSLDVLRALNPWSSSPEMPQAAGTITADTVSAGHLSLKNMALHVQLHGQTAKLIGLSASVFGGTLSGGRMEATTTAASINNDSAGLVHWGNGSPSYELRLGFQGIEPNRLAAIWQERWGSGLASGHIELNTTGWTASELAQRATGRFKLLWKNGGLARAAAVTSSDDSRFARFQLWEAEGTIHDETLTLNRSRINFKKTLPTQSATGTVTFGRNLDLHFQPSGDSLTGPLQLPTPAATRMTDRSDSESSAATPDN